MRETAVLQLGGRRIPVEAAATPIDYQGAMAIQTVLRDITERKRAEAEARQSENLLRAVMEGAPDPVYVKDRAGRILMANPALAKVVGSVFSVDVTALYVGIESGRIAIFVRDITERKQAEQALREGEERLRFALETSHTGAWDLDLVGHTAFRSLEHDRIFGYSELLPQWTYEMFLDHVLPEDREEVDIQFRQATATRSDWNFECRIRRPNGEVRWIWAAGRHRPDRHGGVPRMAGIVQDITERKQAEDQLRELSQRLTYHVDNSPLAVIEWGRDMRLIRWSGAAERVFGWKVEEVLGKRMQDFRWIYDADILQVAGVSVDLRTGANMHRFSANRNYRKDGSVVECEWYNSSLLDSSGKLRSILSLVLDVTERNKAERALQDAQCRVAAGAGQPLLARAASGRKVGARSRELPRRAITN